MEYTPEKKIILWLNEHPGGSAGRIAADCKIPLNVAEMTLRRLAKQGLASKEEGRPPVWRRT